MHDMRIDGDSLYELLRYANKNDVLTDKARFATNYCYFNLKEDFANKGMNMKNMIFEIKLVGVKGI